MLLFLALAVPMISSVCLVLYCAYNDRFFVPSFVIFAICIVFGLGLAAKMHESRKDHVRITCVQRTDQKLICHR